jgi:hypothetical protein
MHTNITSITETIYNVLTDDKNETEVMGGGIDLIRLSDRGDTLYILGDDGRRFKVVVYEEHYWEPYNTQEIVR